MKVKSLSRVQSCLTLGDPMDCSLPGSTIHGIFQARVLKWGATAFSKSPEINPCTSGQLIFDKGGKNIQWSKDNLLNKWCWEDWSTTCKRMKLDHFLTLHTKINSKWIKDLNVRPEIIELLEENIGKTLSDIHHSRILYDQPPRILEIKAKINKCDLIKSFCTTKETTSKVKRQPSEWKKIIANEATDKQLISKT